MRDGTGKLPTPDSHVDGENGAKTMVYNMKRNSKKRGQKKNREKEKFKKYNNKKEEFFIIDHIVRARPRMLLACENV